MDEQKLSLLYPPFRAKVEELLQRIKDFQVTQAFRSYPDQAKLYFQGRTTPGSIVTNARPGESAHNFGLAVDLVHMLGNKPDWYTPAYDILGPNCTALGLVWGGNWSKPDRPHVQWPGYVTATDLGPLRAIERKAGEDTLTWLQRVWAAVENRQ